MRLSEADPLGDRNGVGLAHPAFSVAVVEPFGAKGRTAPTRKAVDCAQKQSPAMRGFDGQAIGYLSLAASICALAPNPSDTGNDTWWPRVVMLSSCTANEKL